MFYRRKLPHWQPEKAEFFVTFRLAGSLPKTIVTRIKSDVELLDQELAKKTKRSQRSDRLSDLRKRYKIILAKYKEQLDKAETSPTWLSKSEIAEIVTESIHYRNNKIYDLYAYCIMRIMYTWFSR